MILTATASNLTPVVSNQKLLIACWATLIVLVLMSLVFMRSRRRFALAVLPLTIPPVVHLASGFLANTLNPVVLPLSAAQIRIIADLVAALVACVLIGVASTLISKRTKTRIAFIAVCALFVIVFSSFLIMSSVTQFVPLQ